MDVAAYLADLCQDSLQENCTKIDIVYVILSSLTDHQSSLHPTPVLSKAKIAPPLTKGRGKMLVG
jgi:hypothetical protein